MSGRSVLWNVTDIPPARLPGAGRGQTHTYIPKADARNMHVGLQGRGEVASKSTAERKYSQESRVGSQGLPASQRKSEIWEVSDTGHGKIAEENKFVAHSEVTEKDITSLLKLISGITHMQAALVSYKCDSSPTTLNYRICCLSDYACGPHPILAAVEVEESQSELLNAICKEGKKRKEADEMLQKAQWLLSEQDKKTKSTLHGFIDRVHLCMDHPHEELTDVVDGEFKELCECVRSLAKEGKRAKDAYWNLKLKCEDIEKRNNDMYYSITTLNDQIKKKDEEISALNANTLQVTLQLSKSVTDSEKGVKKRITQLEDKLKAEIARHTHDMSVQKAAAAAEVKQAEDSKAQLAAEVSRLANHEKELESTLSAANRRGEEYKAFFEALNCAGGSGDDSSAQKISLRILRQFHSHITKIKIYLATVRREVAEFQRIPQEATRVAKAFLASWVQRIQNIFRGKLDDVSKEKDTRAEKLGEELGQARVYEEQLEKSLVREQGKSIEIRNSMLELEAEGVKKAINVIKMLGLINGMKATEGANLLSMLEQIETKMAELHLVKTGLTFAKKHFVKGKKY